VASFGTLESERMNPQTNSTAVVKKTKKYIIDMLNLLCFSNRLDWAGTDAYNELPLFNFEDPPTGRIEQRGALLIHNKQPTALRLLVTVVGGGQSKVCYRIKSLPDVVELDTTPPRLFPMEYVEIDFSIADSALGVEEAPSYSFATNLVATVEAEKSQIFCLLRYLLDCHLTYCDNRDLFEDMLIDVQSHPPLPGEPHFQPIYSVMKEDAKLVP